MYIIIVIITILQYDVRQLHKSYCQSDVVQIMHLFCNGTDAFEGRVGISLQENANEVIVPGASYCIFARVQIL